MCDIDSIGKNEKTEKKILKISLYTGILFVIIEIFMAIYSKSQAVLMDSIFDMTELIIIGIAIFLVPILHKPVTENNPYGFSQMESLFIVFKGFMLISVTVGLGINNIQIMLNGGNHINNFQVAIFQLILTIISTIILMVIIYLNKKVSSPTIDMEIYGWKVDVICSFSIFIAFLIPEIFKNKFFSEISPYLDQILVIIIVLLVIPAPIKIFFRVFKDIFLFAPEKSIMDNIKKHTKEVFCKYKFKSTFFDVTRTGRKMWVEIYFTTDSDIVKINEIKNVKNELENILKNEYVYIHLELIPDV